MTVGNIVAEVSRELHVPLQRLCLHLNSNTLCHSTRLSALSSSAGSGETLDIHATVLAPQYSPYPTRTGVTQPPWAPVGLYDGKSETSSDSRQTFR
mmetsp:Transcript_45917/g.81385  ORF Transcript_45917/g.81385 Transcript_45917/m.81385 type:complete len:96 (+) Transcript_45917:1-288(+)